MSPDDRHPDDRPDPNTSPCDACGHVWFPGERLHVYVGDEAERPEDAEVLCVLCLKQRGLRPAGIDAPPEPGSWSRRR